MLLFFREVFSDTIKTKSVELSTDHRFPKSFVRLILFVNNLRPNFGPPPTGTTGLGCKGVLCRPFFRCQFCSQPWYSVKLYDHVCANGGFDDSQECRGEKNARREKKTTKIRLVRLPGTPGDPGGDRVTDAAQTAGKRNSYNNNNNNDRT